MKPKRIPLVVMNVGSARNQFRYEVIADIGVGESLYIGNPQSRESTWQVQVDEQGRLVVRHLEDLVAVVPLSGNEIAVMPRKV